ncbi:hypothetical protein [Natronorubrum tibetense]|uniref:Uncharacterized protein n=1 Tax=Natronorubrum tibetense GA33 TaxID=1114856 RepID=L9VER7_9EURY|nr:hypothetical protein [Natronorubrum tibetense]ELY35549.1 hypothetical protein C496_23271 [Natronorubrum tibetense GA33]
MGSTIPTPTDDKARETIGDATPGSLELDPTDDGFKAAMRQAIIDEELDDEALEVMTEISEAKYTFTCICTCKCTLSC